MVVSSSEAPPSEGLSLAYSRLTLPSYFLPAAMQQMGEEERVAAVKQCIQFELGAECDVRVPFELEAPGGVVGFSAKRRSELRRLVKRHVGVEVGEDLESFTCFGTLRISELCLTEKLLSNQYRTHVYPDDDMSTAPPPLEPTQSANDRWTCSICLCIFINPTTFPCGHTCCRECIQPILASQPPNMHICPLCRESIPSNWSCAIDETVQKTVEDMFIHDKEYVDRKKEVAEQIASLNGVVLYSLPPTFSLEEMRRSSPKSSLELNNNLPMCSRQSISDELWHLFEPFVGQDYVHSSNNNKKGACAERFHRFYRSVRMTDFDSVQVGAAGIKTTLTDCVGKSSREATTLFSPPLLSTTTSQAVEALCRRLLLSSVGLEGEASFFDLCVPLVKSFISHSVCSIASTAESGSDYVKTVDFDASNDVTCDNVLSGMGISEFSVPLHGHGGPRGVRFILTPSILEICDRLPCPEHECCEKDCKVYMSSTSVSLLHDILVDMIDSLLSAAGFSQNYSLDHADNSSIKENLLVYAAGPVLLQNVLSQNDIVNEDDGLNSSTGDMCFIPSSDICVDMFDERRGTPEGVLSHNNVDKALEMLFPDDLGYSMRQAALKALHCFDEIPLPSLFSQSERDQSEIICSDLSRRCDLTVCPQHVALIIKTLLLPRDNHSLRMFSFVSTQAVIAISAATELFCRVVLTASGDQLSRCPENSGGTNFLTPSNILSALSVRSSPLIKKSQKLDCDIQETTSQEGECGLFDLQSFISPNTLLRFESAFDNKQSQMNASSFPMNTLCSMENLSFGGVFVSPLSGSYLQILKSKHLKDSVNIRERPLLDAVCDVSQSVRKGVVLALTPTPSWRMDFGDNMKQMQEAPELLERRLLNSHSKSAGRMHFEDQYDRRDLDAVVKSLDLHGFSRSLWTVEALSCLAFGLKTYIQSVFVDLRNQFDNIVNDVLGHPIEQLRIPLLTKDTVRLTFVLALGNKLPNLSIHPQCLLALSERKRNLLCSKASKGNMFDKSPFIQTDPQKNSRFNCNPSIFSTSSDVPPPPIPGPDNPFSSSNCNFGNLSISSSKNTFSDEKKSDADLERSLKTYRDKKCKAMSKPAYCVFSNKELLALVQQRPSSLDKLRSIKGFGPKKVDLYGNDIIRLCHSGEPMHEVNEKQGIKKKSASESQKSLFHSKQLPVSSVSFGSSGTSPLNFNFSSKESDTPKPNPSLNIFDSTSMTSFPQNLASFNQSKSQESLFKSEPSSSLSSSFGSSSNKSFKFDISSKPDSSSTIFGSTSTSFPPQQSTSLNPSFLFQPQSPAIGSLASPSQLGQQNETVSHFSFNTSQTDPASEAKMKQSVPSEEAITAFLSEVYTEHNPGRLSKIPSTLEQFRGREFVLIEAVEKKYGVVFPQEARTPFSFGPGTVGRSKERRKESGRKGSGRRIHKGRGGRGVKGGR